MRALLAVLIAGSVAAPMANAMPPPVLAAEAFTLSTGRTTQGPREAWVRVTYAVAGQARASIAWLGAMGDGDAQCTIEGGSYVRGSTRADRGGARSLRLIDTREAATDVVFDGERLLLIRRGRVVAAYVRSEGGAPGTGCATPAGRG